MDCATQASPSASVSPPISPLKFVTPSTSSSLPPIKNFPTWSRTSLERTKHTRCLTRDVIGIQKEILEESACRSTQTSPANATSSHRLQTHTMVVTKVPSTEQQNAVMILEKKLAFVQAQYEDVLAKLRDEVGVLKKENVDLTFQVLMKNGNLSLQPERTDAATSPAIPSKENPETLSNSHKEPEKEMEGRKANEMKIFLLDNELKALKVALQEAKDQNTYLVGLVEKQRQRQRITVKSAKQHVDSTRVHPPGNMGHQPPERPLQQRNPNILPPVEVKKDVKRDDSIERRKPGDGSVTEKQYTEAISKDEIVNRYIVDDSREIYEPRMQNPPFPTYEISELRNGRYKGHLIGPFKNDLPLRKPLEPLPRLARVPARSVRYMETLKSDVPLPAVRAPPGSLAERQKRAHALHVQRQKNNREFTLFKLM